MNIRAGDRRHPETLPYRCCLSTLAGFGRLCRAGPARTLVSIIEQGRSVKCFKEFLNTMRDYPFSNRGYSLLMFKFIGYMIKMKDSSFL